MTIDAQIGRKRTILLSISILLVSLHTIYFYHSVQSAVETKKLIQQIIRFILTVGLLFAAFRGKKWAAITLVVLFSVTLLVALVGLVTSGIPFANKIPLFVMVFVYSIGAYHFGISKNYKAFAEYQREQKNQT